MILATADCDNYQPLDITGIRDAIVVKEKIFTKLQISDDQQPFFSIYRTEIGSFALGAALSDDALMDLCLKEGDDKGTVKFLVQHTSAPVHLRPPPITSHVPPVLPYDSFRSPSQRARSTRSNHETMSSTSESFPMDQFPGNEGSASDELDHSERERLRNPAKPGQQYYFGNTFIPASPLDPRRIPPLGTREASPRRPLSPSKTLMLDTGSSGSTLMARDRNRGIITPTAQQNFSPNGTENPSNSPSWRKTHGHSASDTAPDRDRQLDIERQQLAEREARATRRDGRLDNAAKSRRQKDYLEPWVVVPSPKTEKPSVTESTTPRAPQHITTSIPSSQYQSEATNLHFDRSPYARSRGNLPPVPVQPRGPPPPPPTEATRSHRTHGQVVPPNWAVRYNGGDQRTPLHSAKIRLAAAKSLDNLRSPLSATSNSSNSSRKPSQSNLARPPATTQKNIQAGSFVDMDSPTSRREPPSAGLPKSFDSRNNFSPTYPTRPQISTSQNQSEVGQSTQRSQSSRELTTNGTLLNPSSWKTEDMSKLRPATDDIGASPTPTRVPRPLPPVGGSYSGGTINAIDFANFDIDDSRSPRGISPHHPYAAPSAHTIRALPPTASLSQTGIKLTDAATVNQAYVSESSPLTRGHGSSSPDSPRRAPMDKREADLRDESALSSAHDSPVYDGDVESSGTIRRGDRNWAAFVGSQIGSEGTLKPGRGGDKRLPEIRAPLITGEISSSTIDDGNESDIDYDEDDGSSLWAEPLKPQNPPKSQHDISPTINTSGSMISRSPYGSAGIPPNFPPPNFPPPPPPPIQTSNRRKTDKSGRSNRDSQFIKAGESTWAPRPPPEEITERLDSFFPNHDLDEPLIDSSSGGSSPTAAEPPVRGFQGSSADKEKKFRHKKSIRVVAAEGKKKIDRSSKSDSSTVSTMLRRRNTKLWGSKLEEVTNFPLPNVPPVPESPTHLNPKPIFKWVRGELIGKGTYGRVYLALNATTGEMIAVKQVEIPKTEADRDDKRQVSVVEALKLESETLKDLDHPNIVQYLGFEQTPDFLSIFLEYVPGGSVAGCLRKHGKFDDQVSRSFTSQILAGLEYLHHNGIIHRDLKADNILVDPSGICKISDFGISKRTEDINENGIHTSMQGSVFWMAPEVVQAARKGEQHGYNGKVDIWSLGCVVLEMWAGRRPWQDTDAIAVIYELITKQKAPPVPPDVKLGPDADDFRAKCFAIKPDERPSASELRLHPYLIMQPGWTFTGFK